RPAIRPARGRGMAGPVGRRVAAGPTRTDSGADRRRRASSAPSARGRRGPRLARATGDFPSAGLGTDGRRQRIPVRTQAQGRAAGGLLGRRRGTVALPRARVRRRRGLRMTMPRDAFDAHAAKWWHALDDGRIQCDLCPRDCRLHDGQRGLCFVRARQGDAIVLTTYGRSSGFCIDPIEKKPLNHFYPGSSVLSFGTAGCNLACKFCQNWDISKSREMDRLMDRASPARIAEVARDSGCTSVAFTYNDPVIFAEYAMDAADACHALGVKTVAVTAGHVPDAPRQESF